MVCADCGEKLYYSATNNYRREGAYFFCSSFCKNGIFSAHYIREKTVEALVLEALQRPMWYIRVYEPQFLQEQARCLGIRQKKEQAQAKRELDKAKSRVSEIDALIQKLYEDLTRGLLTEERFATLSMSYEMEQRALRKQIPALETGLTASQDNSKDLQHFMDRAKQVTRLTELTPKIVHEFIQKIVVSKPTKIDGKRHQTVDIYYNTIGLWQAPAPKEMECLFQQHQAKHSKKTA